MRTIRRRARDVPTGIGGMLSIRGRWRRRSRTARCSWAVPARRRRLVVLDGTKSRHTLPSGGGPFTQIAGRGRSACRCGWRTWRGQDDRQIRPSRTIMASLDLTSSRAGIAPATRLTLDYKPDGADENRGWHCAAVVGSVGDFWPRRRWSSSTRIRRCRRRTASIRRPTRTHPLAAKPGTLANASSTIADGRRRIASGSSTR